MRFYDWDRLLDFLGYLSLRVLGPQLLFAMRCIAKIAHKFLILTL
jgi:hypothetical protein